MVSFCTNRATTEADGVEEPVSFNELERLPTTSCLVPRFPILFHLPVSTSHSTTTHPLGVACRDISTWCHGFHE